MPQLTFIVAVLVVDTRLLAIGDHLDQRSTGPRRRRRWGIPCRRVPAAFLIAVWLVCS